MTNTITIVLVLLVVAVFAIDHFFLQQNLPIIVGKGLDNFIEYVSFWR